MIIDEKYEKRKNYYETLIDLKQRKKNKGKINRNGVDEFKLGFDSAHNNLIYSMSIPIKKKKKFFKKNVSVGKKIETNDIIVGIQIISNKDGGNGNWIIDENPLLTYHMSINFNSNWWSDLDYELILYLMELPDENII